VSEGTFKFWIFTLSLVVTHLAMIILKLPAKQSVILLVFGLLFALFGVVLSEKLYHSINQKKDIDS
jgi:predicted membrane channel-forming protein YqfA (hemolysin III family)